MGKYNESNYRVLQKGKYYYPQYKTLVRKHILFGKYVVKWKTFMQSYPPANDGLYPGGYEEVYYESRKAANNHIKEHIKSLEINTYKYNEKI